MRKKALVAILFLTVPVASSAASIYVLPDQLLYAIGDTITLTVVGNAEGEADTAVYGELVYDSFLTDTLASSQTQHTSFAGGYEWMEGALNLGDGHAAFVNQIAGLSAFVPDQLQVATVTLRAQSTGVVDVYFSDLMFFGLDEASPSAVGTSFSIVESLGLAAFGEGGSSGLLDIDIPSWYYSSGTSPVLASGSGAQTTPVPEPTTGVLFALGLVGLAVRRRQPGR